MVLYLDEGFFELHSRPRVAKALAEAQLRREKKAGANEESPVGLLRARPEDAVGVQNSIFLTNLKSLNHFNG